MTEKPEQRKRYAVVGTGWRVQMFIDPIARDFAETSVLVGFCDPSRQRMEFHRDRLQKAHNVGDIPLYGIEDFDKMIEETKPDTVIVCTVDAFHHEYVVRSLDLGCDVICEKPLTIDADKYRQIDEAVKRSGKSVRVTFNVRWGASVDFLKEQIESGVIGRILHVNLQWDLNTSHGADYFRRWHSEKDKSGGLLLHKSTHHFDLINWLINGIPAEVYAQGGLYYYGKKNAIARGDEALTRYERYADATPEEQKNDPFFFPLDGESYQGIYAKAEKESGYIRDRNVFRDRIDIEDVANLIVRYRHGPILSYTLVAFCPYEGFRLSLTGERGRIDYTSHTIIPPLEKLGVEQEQDPNLQPKKISKLTIHPHFKEPYDLEVPTGSGGHGGADPLLQARLFAYDGKPDTMNRDAGHEQGAASLLIGAAANVSMKSGKPVLIEDLFPLRTDCSKLSDLI